MYTKDSIVAERSLPLALLAHLFRRLIRFNLFGILSAPMIAESRQVYHFELNCCEQMNIVKIQCNQWVIKHNKRFKRDFQRVAFLLCVGFCGYGVMRKLGSSVVSPLSGR